MTKEDKSDKKKTPVKPPEPVFYKKSFGSNQTGGINHGMKSKPFQGASTHNKFAGGKSGSGRKR